MTFKAARTTLLSLSLAILTPVAVYAQPKIFETDTVSVQAQLLADGLEHPWGMAFLPDGDVLVTERPGRIRILSGNTLSDPVENVPEVAARGQGGLLDIVLAPDFESSGLIFFSFSEAGDGGAGTAVASAKLVRDGASARLEDVNTIFSMSKKTGAGQHFGSRLVFNTDGTLFITTGDRGDGKRSQDMNDHAGAVLRINQDGSIPADNPSPDGSAHLPEIWTKGHRNPQGAVLDPVTGTLVTAEHGAKGGDEINVVEAGKNYGWPIISYGVNYNGSAIGEGTEKEGLEQPAFYWDPSIAPSGLISYQGAMFPEWNGDLFVGALASSLLSRLERDDAGKITGEERMFEGEFGRIRDVNLAPDGAIWLLTDESNGAIIRLSRAD